MYIGILGEFLNMGGSEIMLILAVVLLLFGGKKLPELARGLGKGIRDFKDASEGVKREIHRNINAMDIDDDLKAEEEKYANAVAQRSPTQTLEEQMYPKEEVKQPINLNKESVTTVHTDIEAPGDIATHTDDAAPAHINASVEKLETEKDKIN